MSKRTKLPPVDLYPVGDFQNREVSWLAFNARVLEEACDERNPLLERLRFLTIFYTNLDEFFMIRVSGLLQQVDADIDVLSFDGVSARGQLARIRAMLPPMLKRAQAVLNEQITPNLETIGLKIVHYDDLRKNERKTWERWFRERVYPILTPLAVSSTRPFPFISNLSLNLALFVRDPTTGERRLARIKVPLDNLPRLLPLSGRWDLQPPTRLLPLEELIAANLDALFPGMDVGRPFVFRVTRDADVEIAEDEADDLLKVLQQGLRKRRFGDVVRLEIQSEAPTDLRDGLRKGLGLSVEQIDPIRGMLAIQDFSALCSVDVPAQKFPGFVPRTRTPLMDADPFVTLQHTDVLLHHPFDSMMPLIDFIRQAACDPAVVAIKQTLYRTNKDSPIIEALQQAVENGKQVAAIIELKARFDEENNIVWAQRLEQAGVHVVYGIPRLKTHAKLLMIVRRTPSGELVRYVHLGTGNYNTNTAKVYTDLGLLTTDPQIAADVGDLFNHLTGFARPAAYRKLLVAPHFMKHQLMELIRREADHARAGRPGRVLAKCNAIADRDVIRELYAASQAGVRVQLLVRGICCLIPGRPGLSENITVQSVVGRFLEHSRVYWFENGGDVACYLGSADLMDRNLERRVEILAPIEQPELKDWIGTLLERYLADCQRTRFMKPNGTYDRCGIDGPDVHDQLLAEL